MQITYFFAYCLDSFVKMCISVEYICIIRVPVIENSTSKALEGFFGLI